MRHNEVRYTTFKVDENRKKTTLEMIVNHRISFEKYRMPSVSGRPKLTNANLIV